MYVNSLLAMLNARAGTIRGALEGRRRGVGHEATDAETGVDVDTVDAEPSSAMMRGGEFLRNGLPRMLMWVSLLVWTSGGRVGGALAMLWGSTSSSSSSLSG